MFPVSKYKKLHRGPQVITLKDAAFISAFCGVQSGDKVVDAGSGSGWLAVYLGNLVSPKGKVYSYEIRGEFAEIARKNIEKTGLEKVVEVKEKNVFDRIDEKNVDLVTLDLANAEKALPNAFDALKEKGFTVGYLPNVEQVKTFVLTGEKLGFKHVQTLEVNARQLLVREHGCRPQTKGITHTAFLSFLKKPSSKE
ncbi:MAG: tRNA (adenine-N1)-methyltransferase [Candidatus Micrarchaeia archaeon]